MKRWLVSCSQFADVGRQKAAQTVHIVYNSEKFKETIHDILHSLGMYHENQRPDRDRYVDTIWNNIIPGQKYERRVY